MTVPVHTAWACSEHVGGAVDWRRESTCRRRGRPCRGGGLEPRGGLPDLQSSPAYQSQMLLQRALGDLNKPAIYKVQLITAAVQVQGPAKISAACCFADALALPWAHHRSTPASGEVLQYGGDHSCQPARGRIAILNLLLLLDWGAQFCKCKTFLFYQLCTPDNEAKKDWDL